MRIVMVGPFGLHPNKTMASRALGLARPLAQRGHDVAITMPPWQTPEAAGRTWQEDGVTLRYVPLRGGIPGITRTLIKETLAQQPDVVHCFKPKAYSGLVAWWLWQFHRHHLCLVVDTDDWEGWGGWNEIAPYSTLQKRLFAWQEQWGLRHCHAVTVASRALETLVWGMGVDPEKVAYLPNGPGIKGDSNRLSVIGEEKRVALGVGKRPTVLLYSRLFEFDTERLVEVLAGVKAEIPDLVILSVGSGLYEDDSIDLKRHLDEAHLAEAIVDVGWVEPEELPPLLAAADVGIYLMDDTLLNRTKCPVKLADMAAVGLPIVAEAVGQAPEYVIQGQTGLLRPTGDVGGLVYDLIHLLQNPEERQRLGENARDHAAAHFAWGNLALRLETAYQRICS